MAPAVEEWEAGCQWEAGLKLVLRCIGTSLGASWGPLPRDVSKQVPHAKGRRR